MKKLSFSIKSLILICCMLAAASCDDDGQTIENPLLKFEGTFIGKHSLNGIIPFPDPDTINIEVDTINNKATLSSALLENFPFEAEYNSSNNRLIVSDLMFPTLSFGEQVFYGLEVNSGNVAINNDASELYITLNGISIDSGDVDLTAVGLDYPITPSDNINIKTYSLEPFRRQ